MSGIDIINKFASGTGGVQYFDTDRSASLEDGAKDVDATRKAAGQEIDEFIDASKRLSGSELESFVDDFVEDNFHSDGGGTGALRDALMGAIVDAKHADSAKMGDESGDVRRIIRN